MTVESRLGPSQTGSVVLNVGEDIGALIVYTSVELEGVEIEIRPMYQQWTGQHSQVRPRHLGGIVQYAAVFDALHQGIYEIRLRHDAGRVAPEMLAVLGGCVTRHRLGQADPG